MRHRHLTHPDFTLAGIDDTIARGRLQDWTELREAVLRDRSTLDKVLQLTQRHAGDPYAQRYHFWKHYAGRHAS